MSYKQANSPYLIYQPISSPSSQQLFFKSYDQPYKHYDALHCIVLRRTTQ